MGPPEVIWSKPPRLVQTLLNVSKDGGSTTSALALPVLGRGEGPPQPAGHAPRNTAQDTVVLRRSKGTLVAHGQLGVRQDFTCKAAFQLVAPPPARPRARGCSSSGGDGGTSSEHLTLIPN